MADEEDDLFGDLPVAARVVESTRTEDETACIREMWRTWADRTRRPDGRNVPRDMANWYRGLLRKNRDHSDMMELVDAATYMDRRPRDPADTRRLKMVVENPNHAKVAIGLQQDEDAQRVLYPSGWDDLDTLDLKCGPDDVAKACNVGRRFWSEADHDAAGTIMETMTADEVEDLALDVMDMTGDDTVWPSDLLRNKDSARRGQVVAVAGRSTYSAGVAEQEATKDIDLVADVAAERLLIRGVPVAAVADFHAQAPEGYWDAVQELLAVGSVADDVYDSLEARWDWHPDDRKKD